MLEGLGLSHQTEAVYLAMLKAPTAPAQDLAMTLDLAERQVQEALGELAGMSLLQPSTSDPRALRPVHPEAALQALVARRQAVFACRQEGLAGGKGPGATLLG